LVERCTAFALASVPGGLCWNRLAFALVFTWSFGLGHRLVDHFQPGIVERNASRLEYRLWLLWPDLAVDRHRLAPCTQPGVTRNDGTPLVGTSTSLNFL
jgi:hypothetical protein